MQDERLVALTFTCWGVDGALEHVTTAVYPCLPEDIEDGTCTGYWMGFLRHRPLPAGVRQAALYGHRIYVDAAWDISGERFDARAIIVDGDGSTARRTVRRFADEPLSRVLDQARNAAGIAVAQSFDVELLSPCSCRDDNKLCSRSTERFHGHGKGGGR